MLYRKNTMRVMNFAASILCASLFLSAQRGGGRDRDKDHKPAAPPSTVKAPPPPKLKGPRAIAVLQWQVDDKGMARLKLLPVAIVDGEKYYDAAIYEAQPVPLALGQGVVYEVLDRGHMLGYFTVENALQTTTENEEISTRWMAYGSWEQSKWGDDQTRPDFLKPTTTVEVKGPVLTRPEAEGPRTAATSTAGAATVPKTSAPAQTTPGSTPATTTGNAPATSPDSTAKASGNGTTTASSSRDIGDLPPREPADPDAERKPRTVTTVYDENGKPMDADSARKATGPTLKRKTDEGVHPDEKKPDAKPANPDDDQDRPRFGTKSGSSDSSSTSSTSSTTAPTTATAKKDDDSSRPRFKKPDPEKTKTKASLDDDPDRPHMKRSEVKPQADPNELPKAASIPFPSVLNGRWLRSDVPSSVKVYETAAVSDVENTKKEEYLYQWDDDERRHTLNQVAKLARADVSDFLRRSKPAVSVRITAADEEAPKLARKSGTPPPPSTKAPATKSGKNTKPAASPAKEQDPLADFADIQFQALDLDHNNTAELVFTARFTGTVNGNPLQTPVFVTVVARVDVNGNPRKLYSSVTDATRLDITPRLELVDAIDPDRKGHGVLLFRRIKDGGSDFVLLRVQEDSLTELFHGGSGG